jgi:HEAT repeat protein
MPNDGILAPELSAARWADPQSGLTINASRQGGKGLSMTKHSVMAAMLFLAISISIAVGARAQDTAVAADVRRQIVKLQSGSPKQKIDATQKLAEMGPKAAPSVPYLIELIDSNEKHETLWDRLWNTVSVLGTSGRYVMRESQLALAKISRPAVEPLSAALLRHPRPRVRGNAAIVLGNIKDLQSVGPLIESLRTDKTYEVRMWSAEALSKMAEMWSIDSLGNAVQALIEALRDRDPNVRQKAAYALGKMKTMEAVPALIEALQTYGRDSDAGLALFMITDQRLGDDPQKWREWWYKNEQR